MASLKILAASFALATLVAPALAQEAAVYKGVDDKGHVVYANSPKGLRNAQRLTIAEPAISGTVAPVAPVIPTVPRTAPVSNTVAAIDARSELVLAQKSLDQALADQDSGKEPLPGERLGTSTGGSRLAPSYFSRQDDLGKAVQAARSSLEKASAAR